MEGATEAVQKVDLSILKDGVGGVTGEAIASKSLSGFS